MGQVCVWAMDVVKGNVGHSSLLADRAKKIEYISWWPTGEGISVKDPKVLSTVGHDTPPYRGDVESEKGNPTEIITLNCLDDEAVASWWRSLKDGGFATGYKVYLQPKNNDYDLFRNNCSTIVLLALRVGVPDAVRRKLGLFGSLYFDYDRPPPVISPGDISDIAHMIQAVGG
jgi:hypothetical protein